VRPVLLWSDRWGDLPNSELGRIDGTGAGSIPYVWNNHCPGQRRCWSVLQPLGARVLFTAPQLAQLEAVANSAGMQYVLRRGEILSVSVDHVGRAGGPAVWTYRLLQARWRDGTNNDDRFTLAVWPD
jgi:hypothetical protein